jgi:hypothetical protein
MPFKPGQSGNPKGRSKGTKNKSSKSAAEITQLARGYSPECVERLMHWVRSDKSRESVQAAQAVLARAWGQPPTHAEVVTKTLDIAGSNDKIEVTFVMPDPKLWQDDPPPSHYSVH